MALTLLLLLALPLVAAAAAPPPPPPTASTATPAPAPPPPVPLCSAAGAPLSPGLLACSASAVALSGETLELSVDVSLEDSEYELRFWLETLVASADVSLKPPGDLPPLPAKRLYREPSRHQAQGGAAADRAQWLLRARASPGRWVVRVKNLGPPPPSDDGGDDALLDWPLYVAARLAAVPSRVTLAAADRAALAALERRCCAVAPLSAGDTPTGPACALLRDVAVSSPPVRDLCHAEANACDAQGRVTELFLGTGGLDCGVKAEGAGGGSSSDSSNTSTRSSSPAGPGPLALIARLAALRALDLSGVKGVDATAASVSETLLRALPRLRHLSLDAGAALRGTELACGFVMAAAAAAGQGQQQQQHQLLSLSLQDNALVAGGSGGVPACFLGGGGRDQAASPLRRVYLGGNALEGALFAPSSSSSLSLAAPRVGPALEVLWMPAMAPPPGLSGDLPSSSWAGADRLRVVNLRDAGSRLGLGLGGGGGGKAAAATTDGNNNNNNNNDDELEASLEQAGGIVFFDGRGTGLDGGGGGRGPLLWDDGPGGHGELTASSAVGSGGRRLSGGAVAGVVIGCLVAAGLIGLAVGAICCAAIRKRRRWADGMGGGGGGGGGAAFGDVEVTGAAVVAAAGGGGGGRGVVGGGVAAKNTATTTTAAAAAAAVEAGLGHQGAL